MKKLLLSLVLTASVWSSFSHAANYHVIGVTIKQGATSATSQFTLSPALPYVIPSEFTTLSQRCLWIQENITITWNYDSSTVEFAPSNNCSFKPPSHSSYGYNITAITGSDTQADPTQTCKGNEGGFIDGFHNSLSDFCANIGTTGGINPQPLLCTATNISEIPAGSGNFQHTVTANSCTAEDGPTAPEGENPDPEPCTENCEPTDPPPSGGNDGSDIPSTGGGTNNSTTVVTGTQTDNQGNVTNINMQMEQDYSPITERINETNERLKAENENSSTIIDRLNDLIHGTTENGQKLDAIADAIGSSTGTDTSGIEGKLDGISDELGGLRDDLSGNGSFEDGQNLANDIDLPDESDVSDFFSQINDVINNEENTARYNGITTAADGLTSFQSLPQFFEFSSENCAPIPFWHYQWDVCQYTPTIRTVLTFITTMLLILFLVRSVVEDLKKIRLSV
jgi:hypothetical protein